MSIQLFKSLTDRSMFFLQNCSGGGGGGGRGSKKKINFPGPNLIGKFGHGGSGLKKRSPDLRCPEVGITVYIMLFCKGV